MGREKNDLPVVGIVPGDPNGVGAEITVKALANDGRIRSYCNPVVIGSASVLERAMAITGQTLELNCIHDLTQTRRDPLMIDVLNIPGFAAQHTHFGEDQEAAGAASGRWLDKAHELALAGQFDATVMGPISSHSLKMADKLTSISTVRDGAYLVLRSGPLVIAHLTDHVALRKVSGLISTKSVYTLIRLLWDAMQRWGISGAGIGVAGFNPHAEGIEEETAIAPAVRQARSEGISVSGPVGPDSLFRHCIEGRYAAVVAMYHDQGHIPMKTWGFSGNSVLFLGPPYTHMTVAHGTAYDLAGSGKADATMLANSIMDAASLTQGNGFYDHSNQ